MGITHRLLPLCSLLLPLPLMVFVLWGITFQCQYFFKGYGLSEVQAPDSCSPGDGPSQAGCESAPLMEVFSPVHQRLISHGEQQESLGYCRVFHLMKSVQGTDTWLFCGRASWPHQWADTWEVQVPMLDPLFCFSIFHQHRFDNWWLHLQLMRFCTSVCESSSGPGPVWIFSPLAIRSGSGSVTGLSLGAHHK